jgi:hypothetical protein
MICCNTLYNGSLDVSKYGYIRISLQVGNCEWLLKSKPNCQALNDLLLDTQCNVRWETIFQDAPETDLKAPAQMK